MLDFVHGVDVVLKRIEKLAGAILEKATVGQLARFAIASLKIVSKTTP